MKHKLLAVTAFLFACVSISAQTWTQKANYPDNVNGCASFSIGNKGFIGLGWNPGQVNTFWEYNPATNVWSQNTNFPGTFMGNSVSFAISGKGYVTTGLSAPGYTFHTELWQYDTLGDTWTQKASLPGVPRSEAAGFSLNGKGYVGTGWNMTNGFRKDFWEYNPANDTWTQKANFPGTSRIGAVAFSINGKGYMGLGYDSTGYRNDLWEYNPATDAWTQKNNFPTVRSRAACFVIGNTCYVGTGSSGAVRLTDFWQYNAVTDQWSQLPNVGTQVRQGSMSFAIGNKGYVGTGSDAGAPYLNDFWEFSTLNTDAIAEYNYMQTSIFPNPFSSETTIKTAVRLENASVIISNTLGETVSAMENVSGNEIKISRGNLPAGVYFISIVQENVTLSVDRILLTD